jgi:hypothetical protein
MRRPAVEPGVTVALMARPTWPWLVGPFWEETEMARRDIEPKKLVILPGGHFDAYVKGFEAASVPARDWFTQHLAP